MTLREPKKIFSDTEYYIELWKDSDSFFAYQ